MNGLIDERPATIQRLSDEALAGAGLSKPKIRTLRAIATACSNGLDLTALDRADDAEIHAALTEVVGIGPWTAHYVAMRALGWPDAFPPGDVAALKAMQRGEPTLTTRSAVERAEAWRPWRAYALLRLWNSLETSA